MQQRFIRYRAALNPTAIGAAFFCLHPPGTPSGQAAILGLPGSCASKQPHWFCAPLKLANLATRQLIALAPSSVGGLRPAGQRS